MEKCDDIIGLDFINKNRKGLDKVDFSFFLCDIMN